MDCSPAGFSVHGNLQARILKWIAMPSSRGYSQPRDRTQVSCIASGATFPSEPQGKPSYLGSFICVCIVLMYMHRSYMYSCICIDPNAALFFKILIMLSCKIISITLRKSFLEHTSCSTYNEVMSP